MSGDLYVGLVRFCPIKRAPHVDMAVGMLDRGYGIANTGWGTFWLVPDDDTDEFFNILNDCKGQHMIYVDGVLLYFLENVHTSSGKLVLKDNLASVPEAISEELVTWIAIQKAIIK